MHNMFSFCSLILIKYFYSNILFVIDYDIDTDADCDNDFDYDADIDTDFDLDNDENRKSLLCMVKQIVLIQSFTHQ